MSRSRSFTRSGSHVRRAHRRKRPGAQLQRLKVSDLMAKNPVTASPDMTLAHVVNELFLRHWLSFIPVVEDGILLGAIDGGVVTGIDREFWHNTRVDDIFIVPTPAQLLTTRTPIAAVLKRIDRTGQRKFLITDGHRLRGVLTLADLHGLYVRTRL